MTWETSINRERRLRKIANYFTNEKGVLLDVGGHDASLRKFLPPTIKYINLDFEKRKEVDIYWDLNKRKLPFKNNSIDYFVASEVLEHLFYPLDIIKELRRILKPTGFGIITYPNDHTYVMLIKWVLNAPVTPNPFWPYGHLHTLINFKQLLLVIHQFFKIEKVEYLAFSHERYLTFIPHSFLQLLANFLPHLFARNIIIKVKKL
jgi:predicted SAM-dependent methyltransferase